MIFASQFCIKTSGPRLKKRCIYARWDLPYSLGREIKINSLSSSSGPRVIQLDGFCKCRMIFCNTSMRWWVAICVEICTWGRVLSGVKLITYVGQPFRMFSTSSTMMFSITLMVVFVASDMVVLKYVVCSLVWDLEKLRAQATNSDKHHLALLHYVVWSPLLLTSSRCPESLQL